MKTIKAHGNYELISYNEDFATIDYTSKSVGLTLKAFSDIETALTAFDNIIGKLSSKQAMCYNKKLVEQ